ncbi:MAG: trypsin-like peptidase domain-containing protein, partial [Bacteroidia bacterium]|nr:trypsin-like peptidase domain-containing protein [Bacteroidia bacterium]
MKKLLGFVLILIIAGIGGIIGVGVYDYSLSKYFREKETTSFDEKQNVVFTNNQSGFPDEQSAGVNFTYASSIATPAVVHIKSIIDQQTNQSYYFDPFRDFFGFRFYDQRQQPTQPRQRMSSGSGVIISEDGYLVTNNHVINGADEIEVVLNDKRTFTASVIGTDPTTDLALLKVEEKGLPFIKFGNSDILQVGEWVLAVGNPFNLTSTVTAGIVSAKARSINILDDKYRIESFIQTDAVVNPGNSGGALINTSGSLVGINTAIQSQTGSYIGYSFAIPVNIVKKVMDDLLKYGEVQRGFIGVS